MIGARRGELLQVTVDCNLWLSEGEYFVTLGSAHWDTGDKIDFLEEALQIKVLGPGDIFTTSVVNLEARMAVFFASQRWESENGTVFSDLINRLKAGQGQQPSPEPSIPEQPSLELVRELESLEPGITDKLLAILGQGHGPTPVEERRYQLAEALTTAVYPKYKFCEFGRLFLEDEEFLAYYRKIMDPNNWHSLDRKYTLNQLFETGAAPGGDLAECGVYKGASAQLMCRAALPLGKTVHLFDSFQGLPAPPKCRWFRTGSRGVSPPPRKTLPQLWKAWAITSSTPGGFPSASTKWLTVAFASCMWTWIWPSPPWTP